MRVPADREFARLLGAGAVRVAEIVQPIDQLPLGEGLAAVQLERPGEDARIGPRHLAAHPRVDHPREDDPVVRHHERQQDQRDRRCRRRRSASSAAAGGSAAASFFVRRAALDRDAVSVVSVLMVVTEDRNGRCRASLVRRRARQDGSQAHCILAVNGHYTRVRAMYWRAGAVRQRAVGRSGSPCSGFRSVGSCALSGQLRLRAGRIPFKRQHPDSQRPFGS